MARKYNRSNCLFGNIVFIVFVAVQCLDGVFTYKGVSFWGIGMEGSLLVAWIMSAIGVSYGLVAAKLICIGIGVLLYRCRAYNALVLLDAIYIIFALIPWGYLFLTI